MESIVKASRTARQVSGFDASLVSGGAVPDVLPQGSNVTFRVVLDTPSSTFGTTSASVSAIFKLDGLDVLSAGGTVSLGDTITLSNSASWDRLLDLGIEPGDYSLSVEIPETGQTFDLGQFTMQQADISPEDSVTTETCGAERERVQSGATAPPVTARLRNNAPGDVSVTAELQFDGSTVESQVVDISGDGVQTVTFQPEIPINSDTEYAVVTPGGNRKSCGVISVASQGPSIQTPQLLLIGGTAAAILLVLALRF